MLLVLLVTQLIGALVCDGGPIVTTPLGMIEGVYEATYTNNTYAAFYTIPYAIPPVGDLRFEVAKPVKRWTGILKATNTTRRACSQVIHSATPKGGRYLGEEDCLYLNVYVPAHRHPGNPLDVVAKIHGGAFMYGNGYAGAKFLMNRNVIIVSFNYRVGVLGFLSTEDEVVPGNLGMKDQVLALEWIRDNIESFGGNPNSVTLTGLSAGGASVHYHYLSPLSRGLFHRGISQSGVALCPWTIQEDALEKARWIGRQVGCNQESTRGLKDCLKTVNVRELTETVREMRPWLFNPFSPLSLVVEKGGQDRFLPEDPYALLERGEVYDVPWINSVTSEDGLYPAAEFLVYEDSLPDLDRHWLEFAPHVLDYNYTIPQHRMDDVSLQIRKEYLEDEPISNDTYYPLVHMLTDRLFTVPAEEATVLHARATKSPVYYYYFSYVREELESLTSFFAGFDQHEGVSHGDDYMFLFSNAKMSSPNLSIRDQQMQEIFLDMWTSFASTGEPTVKSVEWERVSRNMTEPLRQLHIASPINMYMQDADKIDMHRAMWKTVKFEENNGSRRCFCSSILMIFLLVLLLF